MLAQYRIRRHVKIRLPEARSPEPRRGTVSEGDTFAHRDFVQTCLLSQEMPKSIHVTDCNRNWLGLQSACFWDHIHCLSRHGQDHINCH